MKLVVKTLSNVFISAGEGEGLIDQDCVFDEFGIPYIPSKRIKGLLRDSAIQVLGYLGLKSDIVDDVFGIKGKTIAKFHISNLYIPNYENIKSELSFIKEHKKDVAPLVSPVKIKNFFSSIRFHTAIDNITKTAKDSSLRVFRVIDKGLTFEGDITGELSEKQIALLYLSALNVRYMGLARHNGYGKVETYLNIDKTIDECIELLTKESEYKEPLESQKQDIALTGENCMLEFDLELLDPVVMLSKREDKNTIESLDYIISTSIRGAIHKKFSKRYKDELLQKVLVSNAYPYKDNMYKPLPKFIQETKEGRVVSIFSEQDREIAIGSKPKSGFYADLGGKVNILYPVKTSYIHHNKYEYMRTKKQQDNHDIFYYQAIKEGQSFRGYLIGDKAILEAIKDSVGEELYIGRSRSAQYGRVKVKFYDIKPIETKAVKPTSKKKFVIYALSPIVIYNKNGFSTLSTDILQDYIEKALEVPVKIENAIVTTTTLERYIDVWHSRSPRLYAYDIGSSFLVSVEGNIPEEAMKKLLFYGIGELTQLGYGKVDIYENFQDIKWQEQEDGLKTAEQKIEHTKHMIVGLLKEDLKTYFEYEGFKSAEEFKHKKELSNSLIGRLRLLITNATSMEDINEFFKDIKGIKEDGQEDYKKHKKAYKTLEKAFKDKIKDLEEFVSIVDKLYEGYEYKKLAEDFGLNLKSDHKLKFDLAKSYWFNFFDTIRIKNRGK
ncbi:RAMP superfamily CRISPR-associated protein [Hydrogenobaculum acidophilum]